MAFASPSERSGERWNRLSVVRPLVGLGSLPPMYLLLVNSGEPKFPSDRRRQAPVHVPSSWFCTTSTACSVQQLRVCCTPLPVKGSPRFVRVGREVARRRPAVPGTVPAARFAPFEEFPSSAAGSASLRPLPSCRYRPARREGRPKPVVAPTASPLMRGAYARWSSHGMRSSLPRRAGRDIPEEAGQTPKSLGPGFLWGRGLAGLRRAPSPRSREAGPSLRRAAGSCLGRGGEALPVPGGGRPGSEEQGVQDPGGGGGRGSEESRRPDPGDEGWRGSEELRSPGPVVAGPSLRRAAGSCQGGGVPPRSGRVVPGARLSDGAPKNSERLPGVPGSGPEGWDGVRGRDSDAVMLRSAEADPHITEHAPLREQAPTADAWKLPGGADAEAPASRWAIELPPGAGSLPGAQWRPSSRPPEGGPGEVRGRSCGVSVLCADSHRSGGRRRGSSESHEAADFKALLR